MNFLLFRSLFTYGDNYLGYIHTNHLVEWKIHHTMCWIRTFSFLWTTTIAEDYVHNCSTLPSLLNLSPGQICGEIAKVSSQPTELSQLASWSSRLIRILLMEVPHSVLHKFTDHVLPGFPGDVIWSIAFPLNYYFTTRCSTLLSSTSSKLYTSFSSSLCEGRGSTYSGIVLSW